MRARDDIDVASSRSNVDAALVVRRPATPTRPLLERVDLRAASAKLEWPPICTRCSKRAVGVASGSRSRRRWSRQECGVPSGGSRRRCVELTLLSPRLRAARGTRRTGARAALPPLIKDRQRPRRRPCVPAHARHQRQRRTPSSSPGAVAARSGRDGPRQPMLAAVAALVGGVQDGPAATQGKQKEREPRRRILPPRQ